MSCHSVVWVIKRGHTVVESWHLWQPQWCVTYVKYNCWRFSCARGVLLLPMHCPFMCQSSLYSTYGVDLDRVWARNGMHQHTKFGTSGSGKCRLSAKCFWGDELAIVSFCSLATSSGQYSLLQLMQVKLAPEVIANHYNLVYVRVAVSSCTSIQ